MSQPPDITRASEDHAAERPLPTRVAILSAQPSTSRPGSPHAGKFRIATAFLVGVGVAAVAIAVALASQPSSVNSTRAWSDWRPTTGGKLGATEIAEHVAPFYRLSASQQLDVVTLINLSNPNAQGVTSGSGLTVAVNTGASSGSSSSLSLLAGSTVAYNLCGTGAGNCRLAGAPSANRLLLLRREALELALYTFKYISGTANVICVLPPGHTETASTLSSKLPSSKAPVSSPKPLTVAVVFLRQELQPWLNQPLSSTLNTFPPLVSQLPLWTKTAEAGLVDQITAHGLFSEQIESQQTGGNLLVLNQLPPQ
jgi:hypothetical protein